MQRAWIREFNSFGLQLRPQAARLITSFLQECENPNEMVEGLILQTKNLFKSRGTAVQTVIDETTIQTVINCLVEASRHGGEDKEWAQELLKQGIDTLDLGDGIAVYNALRDVKAFDYHTSSKEWIPSLTRPQLFPGAEAKSKIFADRYQLLYQRILLEGEMVTEAEAATGAILPGQRVLTPVESILGNPGRKLTFGLLSRTDDTSKREWQIEDLHKRFKVQLLERESDHLVTDGCFVLAEGRLVGEEFHVERLEVPAAVPRSATIEKDQVPSQFFGGELTDEQLNTLARNEEEDDGWYVILSEVNLDSVRVLDRIKDLLQGYEAAGPPSAYIFMGSFCSEPFVPTADGVRAYREGFERLKFLLQGLPAHGARRTRYIFVPGPKDPGAQMLPRVPLPGYMTCDLEKEVPGTIMASNPCRIRHFSRELVFFRHDVLKVLRRHEVMTMRDPKSPGAAPSQQYLREEMARLLLDQAHLVPLPLVESNLLWNFDHTLRLYPLPDAVFIGGMSDAFDFSYQQCTFGSVGQFSRDASFYAYYPIKGQLDPCDVPDPAA